MRKICLMFVLALSFAGIVSAEDSFPYYSAKSATKTPVIDGVLDDACWQSAEKTAPFVCIGGKGAVAQTRGMLCWDNKNLYIALTCEEPLMDTLKERVAKGLIKPFDESVEIFVDSDYDRATYLQFRVGVLGEKDVHKMADFDAELDKKWSAAVSVNKDSWTVEAVIPLDCLDASPSPAAVWGLNLNRSRQIGVFEWTCWSDTKGGFHSPARFGNLIFANYAEWLKLFFEKKIGAVNKEIMELRDKYPAVKGDNKKLEELGNRWKEFVRGISAADSIKSDNCFSEYNKGSALVAEYENVLSALRLEIIGDAFGADNTKKK